MPKLNFVKKDIVHNDLTTKKWKILICDDEAEVHTITKSVLSDFVFKNSKLEFFSAYSGKEAIEILKDNSDIAIILLDVVMESDYAGLDAVKTIREELKNNFIRIVLRTGQPGYAPEKEVILKYDINDYKEKTELTDVKLYTTIISALRAYKDLRKIERNKAGLEKIIESTRTIFEKNSLKLFADGVLTQLISILKGNTDSIIVCEKEGGISYEKDTSGNFKLLASSGRFNELKDEEVLTEDLKIAFQKAIDTKQSYFLEDSFIGYYQTDLGNSNLVYIEGCEKISKLDRKLIGIFSNNVATVFNNFYLNQEIIDTQMELIETLGETVEKRSKEASHHVRRVANISYELAKVYGIEEREAQIIKSASPMHDVGKIGIPDAILLKADKLNSEEYEIMKTHTKIGRDILKYSKREVLKAASIIAYEHHERWDGDGYPQGLKGDDIHIYGRITAVADVFDALLHKRCYKQEWPLEDVIKYFQDQRGKHFDPMLVDILLNNLEVFKDIEQLD